MKKNLLAALLIITTTLCCTDTISPEYKATLLNCLEARKTYLWELDKDFCQPEYTTFLLDLINDFYHSSPLLEEVLNNRDTIWFAVICDNPNFLNKHRPFAHSFLEGDQIIDEKTELQLKIIFDPIYKKHHTLYCINNPTDKLVSITANDIFGEVLGIILSTDACGNRNPKNCLLTKINAKIAELES